MEAPVAAAVLGGPVPYRMARVPRRVGPWTIWALAAMTKDSGHGGRSTPLGGVHDDRLCTRPTDASARQSDTVRRSNRDASPQAVHLTRSRPGHGGTLAAVVAAAFLVLGLVGVVSGEPEPLVIDAPSFQRGDALVGAGWGEPLSIGGLWAEYDVEIVTGGNFTLAARYAAGQSRPARLLVDGVLIDDRALAGTTGSFKPATGHWEDQAVVGLDAGGHPLRIERDPCPPHISAFRQTPPDPWLGIHHDGDARECASNLVTQLAETTGEAVTGERVGPMHCRAEWRHGT